MSKSWNDPVENRTQEVELDDSEKLRLRSVERRRHALSVLANVDPPVNLDSLARAIAQMEVDGNAPGEETTRRIAVSLHHNHLPKMETMGVIEYDPDEHRVLAYAPDDTR